MELSGGSQQGLECLAQGHTAAQGQVQTRISVLCCHIRQIIDLFLKHCSGCCHLSSFLLPLTCPLSDSTFLGSSRLGARLLVCSRVPCLPDGPKQLPCTGFFPVQTFLGCLVPMSHCLLSIFTCMSHRYFELHFPLDLCLLSSSTRSLCPGA